MFEKTCLYNLLLQRSLSQTCAKWSSCSLKRWFKSEHLSRRVIPCGFTCTFPYKYLTWVGDWVVLVCCRCIKWTLQWMSALVFNGIFSGRQLCQDVKVFWRFRVQTPSRGSGYLPKNISLNSVVAKASVVHIPCYFQVLPHFSNIFFTNLLNSRF